MLLKTTSSVTLGSQALDRPQNLVHIVFPCSSNVLVIIGRLRPVFAFGNKVVQREGRTHWI